MRPKLAEAPKVLRETRAERLDRIRRAVRRHVMRAGALLALPLRLLEPANLVALLLLVGAGCIVAGVWLLAGTGWALIAAGIMLVSGAVLIMAGMANQGASDA